MTYTEWNAAFEVEYKNRTGNTFEEAGGEDDNKMSYFSAKYTPKKAVDHQIDKYNLEDISASQT